MKIDYEEKDEKSENRLQETSLDIVNSWRVSDLFCLISSESFIP